MTSRATGYYERHFICRNQEGYYTNFNIIASYNRRVTPALLARALKQFIDRNPILSLNLFRDEGSTRNDDEKFQGANFKVKHVPSFKFGQVVSFTKIETFDKTVFRHVNPLMCPMDVGLPLWRIIVFKDKHGKQYICIYFEHALFEGLSGVQFHKDLVDLLAGSEEAASGSESVQHNYAEEVIFDGCETAPPVAAEYLSDLFVPSYYDIFSTLLETYTPKSILGLYKNYIAGTPAAKEEDAGNFVYQESTASLSSDYELINFNSEELSKILKFCKTHAIALTSYVEVIGKYALQETIFQDIPPQKGFWSTSSLIAASGRKHLSDFTANGPFQYGCLVTGFITPTAPITPDTDLLERMKAFHASLHDSVNSKQCFKRVGLFPYTNIWESYRTKIGEKDRFTFQISNLGKVKETGMQSEWKIENAWFGGNTGLAYNFVLNVTSTDHNGLNIVLCFRPEYRDVADSSGVSSIGNFVCVLKQKMVEFAA